MPVDCPAAEGGRVFEVRLLGPVQVIRRGREIALGGPAKRAVLALLLLEAGRVVPTGRLIEEVPHLVTYGQLDGQHDGQNRGVLA